MSTGVCRLLKEGVFGVFVRWGPSPKQLCGESWWPHCARVATVSHWFLMFLEAAKVLLCFQMTRRQKNVCPAQSRQLEQIAAGGG